MALIQELSSIICTVRDKKPLVHHITNYVSVNDCANIVLACGGSPVMADDAEEVEEMVGLASALVLNIGTLNTRTIDSMLRAGRVANARGIPVVLDPVGAGATALRTHTAFRLMEKIKIAVIRGNASEVAVLAGENVVTRGVDAAEVQSSVVDLAQKFAKSQGLIAAVTGAQDVVTDGTRTLLCDNGHPMLTRVTGTGCMATSLVGCCTAVTDDYVLSAAAGIAALGLSGEHAARFAGLTSIGTFRAGIFDYIGRITPEAFQTGAKVHVLA